MPDMIIHFLGNFLQITLEILGYDWNYFTTQFLNKDASL